MEANRITPNLDYQIEVYKHRNDQLLLHTKILEKKIEIFKDNENALKIMMNDLENYKIKADMSKEYATYFSPFGIIN